LKTVPRIGRILDLAGLLIFLAGGALYARAWFGFQTVPGYQPSVTDAAFAATAVADGFWRLQKVGQAVMGVGITVFVIAWWTARRVSLPSASSIE
jgi:hypothetical protein